MKVVKLKVLFNLLFIFYLVDYPFKDNVHWVSILLVSWHDSNEWKQ